MSDDSMQDANSTEMPELPQEGEAPEVSATVEAHTPPLPSYADPSFYATAQMPPTPEQFSPPPRSRRNSAQSTRPPRSDSGWHSGRHSGRHSGWRSGRSIEMSLFWQMVRHFPQQYWRVLTRPAISTFDRELWKATWGAVWTQVIGMALISGLSFFIAQLWSMMMMQQVMAQHSHGTATASFNLGFLISSLPFDAMIIIFTMIFTISTYFFNAFVLWALASLLGGRGAYLTHCYCTALIMVPIEVLTLVVSSILHAGPTLGLALIIYALVLQVLMIMSVHSLNAIGAIITVLLPALIFGGGIFEIFGGMLSRLF